jgi:hypothetical protein
MNHAGRYDARNETPITNGQQIASPLPSPHSCPTAPVGKRGLQKRQPKPFQFQSFAKYVGGYLQKIATSSATLPGTVAMIWRDGNRIGFIASRPWHPFFQSRDIYNRVLAGNLELNIPNSYHLSGQHRNKNRPLIEGSLLKVTLSNPRYG